MNSFTLEINDGVGFAMMGKGDGQVVVMLQEYINRLSKTKDEQVILELSRCEHLTWSIYGNGKRGTRKRLARSFQRRFDFKISCEFNLLSPSNLVAFSAFVVYLVILFVFMMVVLQSILFGILGSVVGGVVGGVFAIWLTTGDPVIEPLADARSRFLDRAFELLDENGKAGIENVRGDHKVYEGLSVRWRKNNVGYAN